MKKLLLHSDEITKLFVRGNYPNNHSRKGYNKFILNHPIPLFKNGLPCFISSSTTEHHYDFENIGSVVKREEVDKKELSLIVFDNHTDMYKEIKESTFTKTKINMANWIHYILEDGYSDISLIGVRDFTHSYQEVRSFEYEKFKDRVSFFLGKDFEQKRDFGNYNNEFPLFNLKDFFNKKLRRCSFISLDCDVSNEFTELPPKFVGSYGKVSVSTLKEMIRYIKDNSNLIGFSLFGMFDTFLYENVKKNNVKDIDGKVKEIIDFI